MTGPRRARHCLILAALSLAALSSAMAQRMVSVEGSVVNMRKGPGTASPVLWELSRGYPLQIVSQRRGWLQVRDFEGDQGWVLGRLTGNTPYHVVAVPKANVRKGPGLRYPVVGTTVYGEMLRTQGKRDGWVHVKRQNGAVGWISRRLLWGW